MQMVRPTTPRPKPSRGIPMLSLTMGEPNTDNGGEEERGAEKHEEEEEELIKTMTIHHPNLSKILERRRAMRGIHGQGNEQQIGAVRDPINIEMYKVGGSEDNFQKGLEEQREEGGTGRSLNYRLRLGHRIQKVGRTKQGGELENRGPGEGVQTVGFIWWSPRMTPRERKVGC